MRTRKLGLLLLLDGAGRAQAQLPPATEPPPAPLRWLLGGQVGLYPRVAENWNASGALARPWPVQLLVRGQRERLGVEAGLLLRAALAQETRYTTPYGTTTTRTTSRTWLLMLASRYRLAPQRPARWQFDVEFGFLFVSSRASYTTTFTDARTGQQSTSGSGTSEHGDLPLLGGLGLTYQLTPRLALTADARAGWSYIGTVLGQIFTRNTSYVAPLVPMCGVGASYTLGR